MSAYSVLSKVCVAFLLVQIGASSDSEFRNETSTGGWPCPNEEDIVPCVCTADEEFTLTLDCSQAETIEELARVFTAPFPFLEFNYLKIKQEGCENCSITSLPSGVFGSSVSFIEVDISGTQIAVVEEEVFSASHDTLQVLRLSSNKISSFPFEALGSYKVLGYIYLDKNALEVDSPIPDIESELLTIINLSSNKILVSPGFVIESPAVKHVRLRNTQLEKVPTFDESPISMFRGLERIELVDFGANKITELYSGTIVADASTLKTVDFSQNSISRLEPGFVTGFSTNPSSKLVMSSNLIVRLEQEIWEDILNQLPQENSVDLSGNPLLCGCDVQWLIQSPLKNSLTNTTTCEDGVSIVKYLPEEAFLTNC